MMIGSGAAASGYETYLAEGTAPSLKEIYAGRMEIGVDAGEILNADADTIRMVTEQCGLLESGKLTAGDEALDRSASKKKKNPEQARIRIGKAAEALDFARENGMKVRCGTILRAEETPAWFFNEDWASSSGAKRTFPSRSMKT